MEDYDENDVEYFEFIEQKPLLDTIHESSSFHSDHSHHSQHRRYFRHLHHQVHDHQNYQNHQHHHHKKLQLIKFLSFFILQYAVVSFLFQYQWNLQHPPSLPPESYQVDDDDYMHQSFVQTSNSKRTVSEVRSNSNIVVDDEDESKTDIIIPEKVNIHTAQDDTNNVSLSSTTNGTMDTSASKPQVKSVEMRQTEMIHNQTVVPTVRETKTTAPTPTPSVSHPPKETRADRTESLQDKPAPKASPSPSKKKEKKNPTAAPAVAQQPPSPPTAPLNLIPKQEINFYDFFSDSWLIPKENFLQLNTSAMDHVEQACFQAVRRPGYYVHPTSKMFVDWTDFMVEHMSKWWGVFRIARDPDPTMFSHVIDILDNYLMKQATAYNQETNNAATDDTTTTSPPPLHRTLAMVAFREYTTNKQPERGPLLSSHVLAATLASLIPMGFGRIVMVGYDPDDRTRVFEAMEILEASYKGAMLKHPKHSNTFELTIGPTEFAYAKIPHAEWVKTPAYEVNVPRGAIRGVQMAIQEGFAANETKQQLQHQQEWLGTRYDTSYWKYFYLTEPDTILHTKPNKLLASFREGLDRGLSFFPHRLQPIPHERDLPVQHLNKNRNKVDEGWKLPFEAPSTAKEEEEESKHGEQRQKHFSDRYAGMYLPGNIAPFSNITILDSLKAPEEYHCCDAGKGWPGRSKEFGQGDGQKPCNGRSWWACGLVGMGQKIRSPERVRELHKRLLPYPLMSLEQGTGVVFGPTNAGRRCFPSKTPCPPREMHVLLPKEARSLQ